MKIELAEHSGFCMGVRKAILRIVKELNSADDEIYVYGPIIHNPQTVDVLQKRGLETINELSGIEGRQVAVRTHGIPIEEFRNIKKKAGRVINLTCPRVAQVQGIIKKYANNGFFTLILGDPDHAEVIGLKSYATKGVHIISGEADIASIPKADKYILVSQTTFDRNLFNELQEKITYEVARVEVIDTICDSTRFRQGAVLDGISCGIDTLVVVGGKNSANTKRLASIGREQGINTVHIESEDDLHDEDIKDAQYVLVTAGASTPGWIINNVLEKLYTIKYRKSNFLLKWGKVLLEFLSRSNIFSSIGAFVLSLIIQKFSGIPLDYNFAIIAMLYIFSMYSLNNYFELDFLRKSNSFKYAVYERFGVPLLIISLGCIGVASWLVLEYSLAVKAVLYSSFAFGFIYSLSITKNVIKKTGVEWIKKTYNSKIVATFGWMVALALPVLNNSAWNIRTVSLLLLIFVLILLRNMLIDIIALQSDLILGRDSLPIMLGKNKLVVLLYSFMICSLFFFVFTAIKAEQYFFIVLAVPVVYFAYLLARLHKLRYLVSIKYELLVDLNYLILGAFFLLVQ